MVLALNAESDPSFRERHAALAEFVLNRDPVLVTATVRRSHIIAIKLDREESEVLTWAAHVVSVSSLKAEGNTMN
jgi:hypothetical protein